MSSSLPSWCKRHRAVQAVLRVAHQRGGLQRVGLWRIDPMYVGDFRRHSMEPEGGWQALVSLMTPWALSLDDKNFTPSLTLDDLAGFGEATVQKRLLESMTKHFMPLPVFDGMVAMCELHPVMAFVLTSHIWKLPHLERHPWLDDADDVREVLGLLVERWLTLLHGNDWLSIQELIHRMREILSHTHRELAMIEFDVRDDVEIFSHFGHTATFDQFERFVKQHWLDNYLIPSGCVSRSGRGILISPMHPERMVDFSGYTRPRLRLDSNSSLDPPV